MAVVAGGNRDRSVARPPWVRRHDSQHEGVVAGIMLALVIVAIGIFLFSSQLIRLAGPIGAMLHPPSPASLRPEEGAAPPGPVVVVSLDSPVTSRAAPQPAPADGAPANASAAADQDVSTVAGEQAGVPGATSAAGAALVDHSLPGDQLAAGPPAVIAEPGPAEVAAGPAAEAVAGPAVAGPAVAGPAVVEPRPTVLAQPTARPQPTTQPTPAPTTTPARATTPAPTAVTRGGTAAAGRRARVVRTDGRGVILYSAPRDGARTPAGVPEGGLVTVLSVQGSWAQIQLDARRTGWVPVQFLASE
ncbi:MAG: hypothetical protein IT306_21815 [Chloroflexi bacterium]|nr:hypothetical protein [Chloroflexota bacterium]